MTDATLQQEIEQFLYREARLLSEARFEDWLALLSDDVRYWMPARETLQYARGRDRAGHGGYGPGDHPAAAAERTLPLLDDDKPFLRARIERLRSSMAHAEQPPSRLRYFVTNVEVDAAGDAEWDVRCNLLVYQSRLERTETLYAGCREDRLRREEGRLRIARRKIMLDQTLLPRTISIFF